MRSVFIKAALLACFLTTGASLVLAAVSVQPVAESNGRIVLEITHDYPANYSPLATFVVAISASGSYAGHYFVGPAPVGSRTNAAVVAVDSLALSQPSPYRGARILWARVRIPPFVPVSHVIIDYEPAAVVNNAATGDPLLKSLVINRDVFPVDPVVTTPDPFFARGAGWVQMSLSVRGVYSVTGADLTTAGVAVGGIDPATLRVYTRGGLNEQRNFDDPEASWRAGHAMREIPVRVEAGNDGTLDPGDRVVFYGIGGSDWADYYDSGVPDTLFQEHTHSDQNRYYMTWGSSLPGPPLRMNDRDATPVAAGDVTTTIQREYRERDLLSDFDLGGDGWLWLDVPPAGNNNYLLNSVDVRDLVTSKPQEFRTLALSPYETAPQGQPPINNNDHHAVYSNFRAGQDTPVGEYIWDTGLGELYYEHGRFVRIAGNFLAGGSNQFRLRVPRDLNSKDTMRFAWYAVAYHRRIVAVNDAVGFTSPDTSASANFRASGFVGTGTLNAFDVTDVWNPVRLTGVEVAGTSNRSARFASSLTGARQHYWVASTAGYRKPTVARVSPGDLRAETTGPNMLIICDTSMKGAADRLRLHRLSNLPLYTNASVKVATTQDIYASFSGGMPDPMGIRNYVKFLYESYADANGNPRLGYVLLLGDASEDFRNHVSQLPDYVPSNLFFTRQTIFAFSTDEWFTHLDDQDLISGSSVADVVIGRLPAGTVGEADIMVDKIIGYETQAPRDSWRSRYILVADDEKSSYPLNCETEWTIQSETIANEKGPEFPEPQKIYLTEYPRIAGVKPQSRSDFLEAWNRGAIVINYIGHGSSQQMADEQVFLGSDVSQLNNGLRLPLLMAYSCTIGDFANPAGKSLAEKLLLREEGGAVATITASREAYPGPNQILCNAVFERVLPRYLDRRPLPVGVALAQAKFMALGETAFSPFLEENSWKYNLLCDPALRLGAPRQQIAFEVADSDTLVAGSRHTVRGTIQKAGGGVDTGFDGSVEVVVREPSTARHYKAECLVLAHADYLVAGGVMYHGSTDVTNGEFEVSFRVPRYATTGPLAFATAYAGAGARDAAATIDSVLVVRPPTLEDSLALRPIDGAPRVSLGFKSGLTTVKTGDTVRAVVHDGDGINILSTTNEGKQAVLFDAVPLPIDVNDFFSFDHGGTDTSGVLLFPLPELAVGRHRLVYKVSDSFGATTVDTLFFNVTDEATFFAEAVLNYPNPFPESTQFLFRLSNRASIKLDIFTVSGKRVRHLEQVREAGEAWVAWDGRDASGSDIANGTYLYVATVDFVGVDRPAVTLRGKVAKIR